MIIFTEFDSTTQNAPAGFFTAVNAAVEFWERELINPISVTIQFSWGQIDGQPLDSNALAESEGEGQNYTYAQVKQALTSAATSANDMISVHALPATDPTGGESFFVTQGEALALGLISGSNVFAGFAGMSSDSPFTFDPNDRAVPGDFDAIGAMEHEITEVLGRIAGSGQIEQGSVDFSPLDLFRYVSPGQLALAPEAASFSIDGQHLLMPFNDPSFSDAGDWAPSVVGDSFGEGSPGVAALVSAIDLEVMDVLGFTLAADPTAKNDFNADGKSGFLIQNGAGVVATGEVDNGQMQLMPVIGLGSEWKFVADGDFLGAGSDQFLMENTAGAVVDGGLQNGTDLVLTQLIGLGPEWSFRGAADFLGLDDGDQFLMENTQGALVVGNSISGTAALTLVGAVGPEWKFVGTGDFMGDGVGDFLMQNTAGAVVVGEVKNGSAVLTEVTGLGPEWKFVGTGDFLGDGKDDFLIENTAGAVVVGEVNSAGTAATLTLIAALGPEWSFVGAGDYFGEGHDSFLIENTSGALVVGDYTGGQIHFTLVGALGSEWAFH